MKMNAKENFLRAIFFENPRWVPRGDEEICVIFTFEGMFKLESWIDKWGVRYEYVQEDMCAFPKGHPLPNLDLLDDYEFPDPYSFELSDATKKMLNTIDRDTHLVFGWIPFFLFERGWTLMGMTNFMKSFFTHQKEMKKLLHEIANFNIGIFERYLELGVDGVTFSEDLGHQKGLMISRRFLTEFFIPEYRRCFEPVLKEEKMIMFHSCGCVQDIIEDFIDLEVTILNPVQARANSLELIKKKADGRLALWGAIDTQQVLTLGTPDEVQKEVKRVISILAPGGGYIVAPDQGMPIPEENMKALWTAAEKYGRYPVRDLR